MATLKWVLIFGLIGYVAFVALLYFTQRSLQYFPERFRTAPAAAGLPEAQEVVLDTADGERRAGNNPSFSISTATAARCAGASIGFARSPAMARASWR